MSTTKRSQKRRRPVVLPIKKREPGSSGPNLIKELRTSGIEAKSVVIRVDADFAGWIRDQARKHGKNLTAVTRDLHQALLLDETAARKRPQPVPVPIYKGDGAEGDWTDR